MAIMRAAVYARVSTFGQEPENQLQELRRYVEARGWTAVEYTDKGVSGSKDRRPALDQLVADAKRRKFDVLVCWRLDRLGRNLRHLILLLDELHALGIGFVTLTRVHVSPDLQQARVMYTALGDEKSRANTARALERVAPFLRRQIGALVEGPHADHDGVEIVQFFRRKISAR